MKSRLFCHCFCQATGAKVGEKRKAFSAQFGGDLAAVAKKAKISKEKGAAKPVFLTKKQRQELALKELAAKRKAEREKVMLLWTCECASKQFVVYPCVRWQYSSVENITVNLSTSRGFVNQEGYF